MQQICVYSQEFAHSKQKSTAEAEFCGAACPSDESNVVCMNLRPHPLRPVRCKVEGKLTKSRLSNLRTKLLNQAESNERHSGKLQLDTGDVQTSFFRNLTQFGQSSRFQLPDSLFGYTKVAADLL